MAEVKRSAHVGFRLRPRERVVLEAAAAVQGVYISELVRDASLASARHALRGDGGEPEPGDAADGGGVEE